MKKSFIIILLFLFCSPLVRASDLQLGDIIGPAFVRNADFNGGNTKTDVHFMAGLNVSYPIGCKVRFCEGLFLEPGFAMTLPTTSQFGSTQVAATGVVGNYSEALKIYSGDINFKKHFTINQKLTAFVLSGLGLNYFQLSNINFTDALGLPQALNVSQTSLNMGFNFGLGLAFEVSDKVLVDLGITPHFVFTSVADQSYLTIPVGLHYAF